MILCVIQYWITGNAFFFSLSFYLSIGNCCFFLSRRCFQWFYQRQNNARKICMMCQSNVFAFHWKYVRIVDSTNEPFQWEIRISLITFDIFRDMPIEWIFIYISQLHWCFWMIQCNLLAYVVIITSCETFYLYKSQYRDFNRNQASNRWNKKQRVNLYQNENVCVQSIHLND